MPKEPSEFLAKVVCCPLCGTAALDNIHYAVEWFAHSLDPCDIMNAAMLSEYQCHKCAKSFWV